MKKKSRGLGKGLGELLSSTLDEIDFKEDVVEAPEAPVKSEKKAAHSGLKDLDVTKVKGGPFQPRISIRHEGIEQLAESIKAQGILQPIVVRQKENNEYEIVAGERRWRAAKLAGLPTIPAIVKNVPDEAAFAIALIENIQREQLNPIEEAKALKRLADELSLTHLQVAESVGKSRTSVTNSLRLLNLNEDVQAFLEKGDMEMGHARALLGLSGALQSQVAKTVVSRRLSVRETERIVLKLQENKGLRSKPVPQPDPNIRRLQTDLAEKLGAKVDIRHTPRGKGMVVIRYNDVDELQGILEHIN